MAQMQESKRSHIRFGGGLDTETPRWNVDPGFVQVSLNYECGLQSGYRDIQGIERFDGHPSPSEERYTSIAVGVDGFPLQNYYEFSEDKDESRPRIIGELITNQGDYFNQFPMENDTHLETLFIESDSRLTLFPAPSNVRDDLAVVLMNSGSLTVQFQQSFIHHFAGSGDDDVHMGLECRMTHLVAGESNRLVIETQENGRWVEKGRIASVLDREAENSERGDTLLDSDDVSYTVIKDKGWRSFEVTFPSTATAVRIRRFNEIGSFYFCCIDTIFRPPDSERAVARVIGVDEIPSERNPDTVNRIVVSDINGQFTRGDRLFLSETTDPRISSTEITRIQQGFVIEQDSSSIQRAAEFLAAAADSKRNVISRVPGAGPILGIWQHSNRVFAVRNNLDNDKAVINYSSPDGWIAIELGYECEFTEGDPAELYTLTELHQSGVVTQVQKVVILTGSPEMKDNEGRFILADNNLVAGDVFLEAALSTKVGTITAPAAIELTPYNVETSLVHYETVRADFGQGTKVYGCDKVNQAFEFDFLYDEETETATGIYTPIHSALNIDSPEHIVAFQNHLFLSKGRTVIHSDIGDPHIYTAIGGAVELSTESNVNGFLVEPGEQGGGALAIFNRNRIFVLYGTSSNDWNLVRYREEVGAYEYTIQEVADTVFLDDRGIRKLQTVQAYGNFQHATISEHCRSFLQETGRFGESNVVGSCLIRQKNQYRLFFQDGYGLAVTFDRRKLLGIMPLNFGVDIQYVHSSEDHLGMERSFIGSQDGWVYEMEKGTSFDGNPISAFLLSHYHFPGKGSIGYDKRFQSMVIEAEGTRYADFEVSIIKDYNLVQEVNRPRFTDVVRHVSAFWDTAIWDEFFWDGRALGPARVSLTGRGENIAVLIRKKSDAWTPLLLSGANIRYRHSRERR